MMTVYDEYKTKLCTPDVAVHLVKDGDWVDYSLRFLLSWMRPWQNGGMSCMISRCGMRFPADRFR